MRNSCRWDKSLPCVKGGGRASARSEGLLQSPTACGGAPFAQGGLSRRDQGPALQTSIGHRRRAGVYSRRKICYNTTIESEGIVWKRYYLSAMAGFLRILKSPCVSKEIRFPKWHLPTVYQWNWRAKLAVNTQTPVRGRFCHRTGVSLFARWSLRSTDKK